MIDQIISIFDQTLSSKLTFGSPIRVKNTSQAEPVWIDSITKVKDQYIVNTSNRKDKANLNLKTLESNVIECLHEKMMNLFGDKIK